MKKLKSNLCLALIIIISSITLVACGPKDPETPQPPTTTTITLEEAKTTILNALAIEDAQAQSIGMNVSQDVGNRNIFTKLNTVDIYMEGNFDRCTTISGFAQKNILGSWTKYSLQGENYSSYFDGDAVYEQFDTNYNQTTFEDSYFGLILQSMDCLYIDLLFIDNAWANIYRNTVKKESTSDVYTLTMDIDMSSYVDFVITQCEQLGLQTEGLFGDGEYRQKNKDEGCVELVISFDKNHNILGLDYSITSLNSDWDFVTTKIEIEKYKYDITQPQWVTDYLANQQ